MGEEMKNTNNSECPSDLYDKFCASNSCTEILELFDRMCESLSIAPPRIGGADHHGFYHRFKSLLRTTKSMSLWTKLDKRASESVYADGNACSKNKVLIIGAGPCGLRMAIECAFLGAKVVLVEKRPQATRNNVLHLWTYVPYDLKALGAKEFYPRFCTGGIDHISIRQLQSILLKTALLLGVEVHINTTFNDIIEPTDDAHHGFRADISPVDSPVSQFDFDVLIGADGKRNTLKGFKRKGARGKLAIAITCNFLNKRTTRESLVQEKGGFNYLYSLQMFKDLNDKTGIYLENFVYYKADTHYFVMTAHKKSLLKKGVLKEEHADTSKLLGRDNVVYEYLVSYAKEAANEMTEYKIPDLEFALNHYGREDVAMFDFTSFFTAEHSSRVIERHGHKLLVGIVGDSLQEPFWPSGSGCAKGILGVLDAAYMVKQWGDGVDPLQILATKESVFRMFLSAWTSHSLFSKPQEFTIDPKTRYKNCETDFLKPKDVKYLYDDGTGVKYTDVDTRNTVKKNTAYKPEDDETDNEKDDAPVDTQKHSHNIKSNNGFASEAGSLGTSVADNSNLGNTGDRRIMEKHANCIASEECIGNMTNENIDKDLSIGDDDLFAKNSVGSENESIDEVKKSASLERSTFIVDKTVSLDKTTPIDSNKPSEMKEECNELVLCRRPSVKKLTENWVSLMEENAHPQDSKTVAPIPTKTTIAEKAQHKDDKFLAELHDSKTMAPIPTKTTNTEKAQHKDDKFLAELHDSKTMAPIPTKTTNTEKAQHKDDKFLAELHDSKTMAPIPTKTTNTEKAQHKDDKFLAELHEEPKTMAPIPTKTTNTEKAQHKDDKFLAELHEEPKTMAPIPTKTTNTEKAQHKDDKFLAELHEEPKTMAPIPTKTTNTEKAQHKDDKFFAELHEEPKTMAPIPTKTTNTEKAQHKDDKFLAELHDSKAMAPIPTKTTIAEKAQHKDDEFLAELYEESKTMAPMPTKTTIAEKGQHKDYNFLAKPSEESKTMAPISTKTTNAEKAKNKDVKFSADLNEESKTMAPVPTKATIAERARRKDVKFSAEFHGVQKTYTSSSTMVLTSVMM
ncbi:unnamed protein product [Owenia fusiformis]|uniref:Uncharacterized protein n=1 Tax=Owenia fusiformis TaxID=6347 RepID=A0A8S4PJ88_OWEFU|nr:unnamed protein product [Owenia fusiformis]